MVPTTPTTLSTGLPDLDRLLGRVQPGDTFLWLVEDVREYARLAQILVGWANHRRYPTAFIDFGTPEVEAAVGTSRIHAEFAEDLSLPYLEEHLRELAQYPRTESIFFIFDEPRVDASDFTYHYLETLERVLPKLEEEQHLTYMLIRHRGLDEQARKKALQQAKIVIELRDENEGPLLEVLRADGKFSPEIFHPHRLEGTRLTPLPVRDQESYTRRMREKADELFHAKTTLEENLLRYRQDENTLTNVLENTTEAIVTLDINGYVRTWNQGAHRIFGHTADEAVGKQFYTLIGAGFQAEDEVRAIVDQLRTKTYISNLIVPAQTRDGRKIYIDLTNSVIKDSAGRIIGISLIMREITDRVRSEKQLNRMVHELSLLRDLSDLLLGSRELEDILHILMIGVTSDKGLRFNRAFVLLVDEDRQVMRGSVAIGPADRKEAEEIWAGLETAGAMTFKEIYEDYRHHKMPVDQRFNAIIQGIRVNLHEQEHPFNQLLETPCGTRFKRGESPLLDPIFDKLQTDIVCASPLVSENIPLGVLIADNAITQASIASEDVEFLYLLTNHASSAVRRAYLHEELAQRLRDLERVTGELKANQEKMLQFERLRTVGEMAARVAHEIRNPLAAVGGLARVLKRKMPSDPKLERYVQIIIEEIARLEHIVMEIQTFTRAAVLKMEVADIHRALQLARDMAQPELNKANVTTTLTMDDKIPPIAHDPDRMKQVFLNLILNASQACRDDGEITITTSLRENHVRIEIADNGEGMSPEVLEKITEPFFTTKASGSGLGVTITTQLVEAHNGFLSYSSEVGRGTTATIKLPLLTSTESTDGFVHRGENVLPSKKEKEPDDAENSGL